MRFARALLPLGGVLTFASACGLTAEDAIVPGVIDATAGSGSGDGAAADASNGTGSGGGIGIDVTTVDVKLPGFDALAPDAAGLFECGGCSCDGATHYCIRVSGGAPSPNPPPPPGPCAEEAGKSYGCHPLPSGCNGVADCACLPSPYGGGCSCSDGGGGLVVECWLP